jgi:CDGSH-type Zn-finger protein
MSEGKPIDGVHHKTLFDANDNVVGRFEMDEHTEEEGE